MAKEKKYMFICDQKKECCRDPGCGTICRHTADINHWRRTGNTYFLRDTDVSTTFWEVERGDNDEI